jgi:hypothetical protein
MAEKICGLQGYNGASGSVNKLLAVYGNDIVDVATGTGFSQNLTANTDAEMNVFLDSVFFTNGVDGVRTYNGSVWSKRHVANCPIGILFRNYLAKMYLLAPTINGTKYYSKFLESDLPKNNTIEWGIAYGSDLVETQGSKEVTSATAGFKTRGINIGDPFIIEDGLNAGEYIVEGGISDYRLSLTTVMQHSDSSDKFLAGDNLYDVKTDDGDILKWAEVVENRLILFKQNSLHSFNRTSMTEIRGVGTSSGRSVVPFRDKGLAIYWHGSNKDRSGFYMTDSVSSKRISNPIQDYIDGITSANYNKVVAWREGNLYRAYVGDVTNTARGISVTNCVLELDLDSNIWSPANTHDVIKCSTLYRESNVENTYIGNDSAEVMLTPSGYSDNGDSIEWYIEKTDMYPSGSEILNTFNKLQVISRDASGIRVRYKLSNAPFASDENWQGLGDLKYDKTELFVPKEHSKACGYGIRLEKNDAVEPTQLIEKFSTFYKPEETRNP